MASSATFAHMALAAAREAQLADLPKITNMELHRPWVLSEADRSTVQVSLSSDQNGKHVFQVHSRSRDTARQDRAWVLHASATLAPR